MIKGFPQFTPNARKGERGVDVVSRVVNEQFKWLFKRNHQEHDFGIDGQVEVVTDEGAVTGQMLAVQIKYGQSFFAEKNKWGYVYRGELKHFNYLSNYPIPAIIIICNPADETSYWVRFIPEHAEVAEAGWKLTVPFENRFHEAKSALHAILPPVQDSLADLKEYWEVNRLLVESPYIHFIIDRPEVIAQETIRPREFFDRLRSTKELTYHCQGKVEISFHGYDYDRRELFEIEEVRKFVPQLCAALPELLFFIRTQQPTHALRALALCHSKVKWMHGRSSRKVTQKVEVTTKEVANFLMLLWPGLNEMTEWLGMSIEENKTISYDVMKCLGFNPLRDA